MRSLRPLAVALAAAALSALPAVASGAPTPLEAIDVSVPAGDAKEPQIALDDGDAAVAVWSRSNGTHLIVQAGGRLPGSPWSAPVDLSLPGRDAEEPAVAVNYRGDAVAVWQRYDGSRKVVQASMRPPGGAWSPPVDLSDATWNAEAPQIAVGPTGEAIAIWSRYNGLHKIVQSRVGAVGGGWGPVKDLSALGGNAEDPRLALGPGGHAVTVWARHDGSDFIVQSAERAAGAPWGPAVDVSTMGESSEEPRVAIGPTGEAVAVWKRVDAADDLIQSSARLPGGGWSEPVDLTSLGADAREPEVAVGPTGEAVAVWARTGSAPTVYAQGSVQPPGGGWSEPVDLSATGESASEPTVGVDATGNAIAAWSRSAGSPTVVEISTRTPGGPWGAAVRLSELGGSALGAQLAFDPEGNGAVIWARERDFQVKVQAVGLDGAPPDLGALAMPTIGTEDKPIGYSVAPFDDWTGVASIAWRFDGGPAVLGPGAIHTFHSSGSFPVSLAVADSLGHFSSASVTVVVYPKARALRNVRVRGRRARLKIRCPSPAGCEGLAKLVAAVKLKRGKKRIRKRRLIGRRRFRIGGRGTVTTPVKLTGRGLAAVLGAPPRGAKAQLTGPGIRHRLVTLFSARKKHRRTRHRRNPGA